MPHASPSGRPLPGWGSGLRRLNAQAGRTALTLAALAGLSLTGCQGAVPAAVGPKSSVSVNSQPARFRDALGLARLHLNALPLAASHPYHLVAFKGSELGESGATMPTYTSTWEFTFSRYAEAQAAQRYEVVSVIVPGAGATQLLTGISEDPALSPIEHWDAAIDPTSPDSPDLLARLQANGVATGGATISYRQGQVRVEAAGKFYTYDPTAAPGEAYSAIQ